MRTTALFEVIFGNSSLVQRKMFWVNTQPKSYIRKSHCSQKVYMKTTLNHIDLYGTRMDHVQIMTIIKLKLNCMYLNTQRFGHHMRMSAFNAQNECLVLGNNLYMMPPILASKGLIK